MTEPPQGGVRGTRKGLAEAAVLVALALAAGAAVLVATRDGVGVSPDSSVYLGVAGNIRQGEGVTVPFRYYPLGAGGIGTPPPGRAEPPPSKLTHYQPLLPTVLSRVSARIVNAVSVALTVLIVGWAVRSFTGSLAAAVPAALLVGASVDVLTLSARVASEPLFLALGMAGLVLLARHREVPAGVVLVGSGLAAGLAILDRYAGVAVLMAGVVLLARRPPHAVALAVIALSPPVAWLVHNGGSTNRALAFHPRAGYPAQVADTVGSWILPAGLPRPVTWAGALLLGAGLLLFFLFVRGRVTGLPWVMLVFVAAYGVMLAVTALFVDASTQFDARLLVPVFVALVTAVACLTRRRAVLVALAALAVVRGGLWLAHDHPGVLEYAGPWRSSPIMQAVRELPRGTVVYSNAPDAIWAVTGRAVSTVPERVNFVTDRENPRFGAQMGEMVETLRGRRGVLVHVRRSGREFVPGERELTERGLRLLREEPDGSVYAVPAAGAAE